MLHFTETRIIQAPSVQVFNTVKDVHLYSRWNPWLVDGKGEVNEGNDITVTAAIGRKRPTFKHKILTVDSPSIFHWCDVGLFTVFAYGQRKRYFKDIGEGRCEYRCELTVTGIGAWLANIFFGEFMRNGLAAEADALKAYIENKE